MTAAVTSATVEASTAAAVETSAAVKAAEARLPAGRESSGDSSVIKATERARVTARLGMRCRKSVLRGYESMLRC